MHVPHRPLRRDDPLALPTGSGISSVITASSVNIDDSTLAFDHTFTATTGLDTPFTTSPFTASPSSTSSANSGIPTAVAASTKSIALGTVIGTCVGAFIVVTSIIIFSFWVYKRYSRSLDKFTQHGRLHRRNIHGSEEQRQSRLGIWNRLKDDHNDDKWEESYHTREAKDCVPADVTPMEKLTMFKRTPSVRTAYTHKSTDASNFSFPSSYAEFDPNLATSLKTSTSGPQPLLKHTDTGLISIIESTATHISSSGVVPQSMPIPTPHPTVSHKWEAAEVVHYSEGQTAEIVNPFEEDEGQTIHNPFFSAQDFSLPRKRSNSASTVTTRTRSRANSTATVTRSKGKERNRDSNATITAPAFNPFDDTTGLPRPTPPTSASTYVSAMEKERALKSLVAALEIPEDEVRDRLRIASMQGSIISATSSEGMTDEFRFSPS